MEYQNLFTQVQVVAEPHHGSPLNPSKDERERIGQPFLVHLFGRLGNAQIGPVYLGTIGDRLLILWHDWFPDYWLEHVVFC